MKGRPLAQTQPIHMPAETEHTEAKVPTSNGSSPAPLQMRYNHCSPGPSSSAVASAGYLVQVARSLGRTVPLFPQLIFTPTATVAAVQPELGAGSPARPPTPAQVRIAGFREGGRGGVSS